MARRRKEEVLYILPNDARCQTGFLRQFQKSIIFILLSPMSKLVGVKNFV